MLLDRDGKYDVKPEVIHHKPTIVAVPNHPDPFPLNNRWPPDPAIYGPPISMVTQEGK
jgi:hypothetical protein